jgi:TPR repeat protein
LSDNTDALIEFGIALFNGTGITKNEAAAGIVFRRAARLGSPIAQNRLARMLAFGRGLPADALQATKWHLIAKAGGDGDPMLDEFIARQKPELRDAAEKAAKPWLDYIERSRS